jgi:hypothetical protein
VLHQSLSNILLFDKGISVVGPIPILLVPPVSHAGKAGFHLDGKVIHVIQVKVVIKQEVEQCASIFLLLG